MSRADAPLDTDAQEWRAEVRKFATDEVAPRVHRMDSEQRIEPQLVRQLFTAGFMGVEIPAVYGGAGRDLMCTMLLIEELARIDPSVAVLADVQNALVVSALVRHGTGDQRRRRLPALAGTAVGSYALSEQDAGSDAFALRTAAFRHGDHYRIRGRKRWVTNASEAELFVVFANADDFGMSAFLVDKSASGVRVGSPTSKLGIRASSTCDIEFDDVVVPPADVLGGPGNGRTVAMQTLNIGKLGIAAQLVGLAQGALDAAFDYAARREQFGQPIIEFQAVQFPLAHLLARLEAARTYLYQTVAAARTMPLSEQLAAAATAKLLAAEVAEHSASQAVETLGGNGYTDSYPVEKLYRDAKIGKIYEGTSNMQLRTIAAARIGRADTNGGHPQW